MSKLHKVLEDQSAGIVKISNTEIAGFVMDEKCDCGSQKIYYEKYDAKFCPQEDKWLESGCLDPLCEYCKDRPDKPIA
jgi:hypothetical protein